MCVGGSINHSLLRVASNGADVQFGHFSFAKSNGLGEGKALNSKSCPSQANNTVHKSSVIYFMFGPCTPRSISQLKVENKSRSV